MTCDLCRSINPERLLNKETLSHHSTFMELEACCETTKCQLCEWILFELQATLDQEDLSMSSYRQTEVQYCVAPYEFHDASAMENWRGFSGVVFFLPDLGPSHFSYSAQFSFFVPRESRLANLNIISGRPISLYSNDKSCFKLARYWRDFCLENHGDSCTTKKQPLPTRILDVGPSDGSQEPSLLITEGKEGYWVALSHCWGTESKFVLDSTNIASFPKNITLREIPPTFRDAIITTRKLGYRYLWIDSLCILQNDHDDWARESARMRDYYKNAIITISADSASGDHAGFLSQRREYVSLTFKLTSKDEINVRRMEDELDPYFNHLGSHISKRAWTLQEFVLSPRSLLYKSGQLVWECHSRQYYESNENSQGESFDIQAACKKRFFSTPSIGKERFPEFAEFFDPFHRWYILVDDYSKRHITFRKDTLPAISGIARELAQQTGNTYAAGIWTEEIHKGLVWVARGTLQNLEEYQAPTWSWASVERLGFLELGLGAYWPITMRDVTEIEKQRATLLTCEVIPSDGDPFGCVTSGSIDLRGNSLPTRHWRGKSRPHANHPSENPKSHAYNEGLRYEDFDHPELDQLIYHFDFNDGAILSEERHQEMLLFQISTWDWSPYRIRMLGPRQLDERTIVTLALLLVQVPDALRETYRRVGIAEVPNVNGLAEDNWEMKDVHII